MNASIHGDLSGAFSFQSLRVSGGARVEKMFIAYQKFSGIPSEFSLARTQAVKDLLSEVK